MTSLENLKSKKAMFDRGLSGTGKAIQMAYLIRNVNREKLKTNANYRAVYNSILRNHYTTKDKFEFLLALEKNLNENRNNNYTKYGFNSVDWNLVKTNPNYRALYNRVANKAKAKSVLATGSRVPSTWNVRSKKQEGGTCWFHAIINGLLMSPRPRAIMKTLVAGVPEIRVSGNVCPSKKSSRNWFLGYIKHRLQGGGPVHNVFKNKNVVRASGLRRTPGLGGFLRGTTLRASGLGGFRNGAESIIRFRSSVEGGTSLDLIWFYNTFFPGDFTNRNGTSTPMFVMKQFGKRSENASPDVPHTLVRNGTQYELTHGYLSFRIKPAEGHAITGFINRNGRYYAYDSATDETIYMDWTKGSAVSPWIEYYKKRHGYNIGGLYVAAIYMKKR